MVEFFSVSIDRCVNFLSREVRVFGDEFLGFYREIFFWNKEKKSLGCFCSCYCDLGVYGGFGWFWVLSYMGR